MTTTGLVHMYRGVNELRKLDPFIGAQTVQTLLYVALHEPAPMKDLADALGMAQTTVSRNVAALTKLDRNKQPGLDLVKAEADPMEMRRKILKLTPKGRKFIQDLKETIEEVSHEAA